MESRRRKFLNVSWFEWSEEAAGASLNTNCEKKEEKMKSLQCFLVQSSDHMKKKKSQFKLSKLKTFLQIELFSLFIVSGKLECLIDVCLGHLPFLMWLFLFFFSWKEYNFCPDVDHSFSYLQQLPP